MKSLFPGYYKYSDEEYDNVWNNAAIVLDTNSLLDFYRLSQESSQDFLHILEEYKDRLYMPYQVAKEYHKNLECVICEQLKNYREASADLGKFINLLDAKRNHPFLPEALVKEAKDLSNKINNVFEEHKDKLLKSLIESSIKDKLAEIYEGKVGKEWSQVELASLCKEGELRYNNKIPPGYKDKGKNNNTEKNDYSQYGDLIIWKDVIGYSKVKCCPIIYVTNDTKEDWFWSVEGRTIGPRPELIKEFIDNTKHLICIYTLSEFVDYAMKRDQKKVDEKAIEELRQLETLKEKIEENENSASSLSKGIESIIVKIAPDSLEKSDTQDNNVTENDIKSSKLSIDIKDSPAKTEKVEKPKIKKSVSVSELKGKVTVNLARKKNKRK